MEGSCFCRAAVSAGGLIGLAQHLFLGYQHYIQHGDIPNDIMMT